MTAWEAYALGLVTLPLLGVALGALLALAAPTHSSVWCVCSGFPHEVTGPLDPWIVRVVRIVRHRRTRTYRAYVHLREHVRVREGLPDTPAGRDAARDLLDREDPPSAC